MRFPKKEIVESIRREYPEGTRIELLEMDEDVYKRQGCGYHAM